MRNVSLAAFSDLIPASVAEAGGVKAACAFWEDLFAQRIYEPTDLVLLPECATRAKGFTRQQAIDFEEEAYQPLLETFQSLAQKHHCYIAYSALVPAEQGGGCRRNRLILIGRDGEVAGGYDKVGLTQGELDPPRSMRPGSGASVVECDFGRVGFFVCFDICFPELMLAYRKLKPDLMLFASGCDGHFQRSQWAYHCRSHLLSAVGNSRCALIDPTGFPIAESTNYRGYIRAIANLDCENIGAGLTWKQIHDGQRKYPGKFRVEIPPYLSTALAYSDDPERDVHSYLQELGIPTLDDYYDGMRSQYRDLGVELFR